MSSRAPEADITAEVLRVLQSASERSVALRAIGGVAVRLHAGDAILPGLRRQPQDIDLVTLRGQGDAVSGLMESLGYTSDAEFNFTNGHRRLLFHDPLNGRQVDVFVGSFAMCHAIPITKRIELDPLTVPLAELLLTKLQVVELNEKDQRDILAILCHHAVGDGDAEMVNSSYVARLCSQDWGLWRTAKMTVERVRVALPDYDIPDTYRQAVIERLDLLWRRIEAEPKPVRWQLRARIGDRLRWYEEPEE